MSVQSEINRIEQNVANTYAVLGEKGATMPSEQNSDNLASTAQTIPEQRAPVEEKDVNFYDYDGTLLYSYTIAEAQALAELPPAPKHEGLVFQEWNWDLADINALTRPMNIGATYITDDGKTRLYIEIKYSSKTIPLHFQQTVAQGVVIDWGDGSETETVTGVGYVNTSHTYTSAGSYIITLDIADGCNVTLGSGNDESGMLGSFSGDGRVICNLLKAVHIGKNVVGLSANAFRQCVSLSAITIPVGVVNIGNNLFYNACFRFFVFPKGVGLVYAYTFYGCHSLEGVAFPKYDNIENIPASFFAGCYALCNVCIPDATSYFSASALYGCCALSELTVPSKVSLISASALTNLNGLEVLRFLRTTPPTVSSSNVFTGIPTTCVVEVPKGSLEVYKNATNYASIAARMVEV